MSGARQPRATSCSTSRAFDAVRRPETKRLQLNSLVELDMFSQMPANAPATDFTRHPLLSVKKMNTCSSEADISFQDAVRETSKAANVFEDLRRDGCRKRQPHASTTRSGGAKLPNFFALPTPLIRLPEEMLSSSLEPVDERLSDEQVKAIADSIRPDRKVVSTGGGAFVEPESRTKSPPDARDAQLSTWKLNMAPGNISHRDSGGEGAFEELAEKSTQEESLPPRRAASETFTETASRALARSRTELRSFLYDVSHWPDIDIGHLRQANTTSRLGYVLTRNGRSPYLLLVFLSALLIVLLLFPLVFAS